MKLCDFIKEYRKNNNYSLRDFSRISSISASELCNIENSNTISKKTLEKLSKYFNIIYSKKHVYMKMREKWKKNKESRYVREDMI